MLQIFEGRQAPQGDLATQVAELRTKWGLLKQREANIPALIGMKIIDDGGFARPAATEQDLADVRREIDEISAKLSPLENQLQAERLAKQFADERESLVAQIEEREEICKREERGARIDPSRRTLFEADQRYLAKLRSDLATLDANRAREATFEAERSAQLPILTKQLKVQLSIVLDRALALRDAQEEAARTEALIRKFEITDHHTGESGGTVLRGVDQVLMALVADRSTMSFATAVSRRPNSVLERFLRGCKQLGIVVSNKPAHKS
jgi:hypothetical protein